MRDKIVAAFNRLVLSTRRPRPPIASLLREAGVARSTFYKHFDDKDSLLLEAMGGPLSLIADAAIVYERPQALAALLDHFWEQRRNGAEVLAGRFAVRLVRSLAEKIAARAPELERNDAVRIADTLIAMLRLWITGETPGGSAALAEKMVASALAQRAAFAAAASAEHSSNEMQS
jgi:AcrR family transcriptional regulator